MNTIERHLTDAELMRVLDDEGVAHDDGEAASAGEAAFDPSAHAATCDRCGDALASLRADSEQVTTWLERAAFEEPAAAGSTGPRAAGTTAAATAGATARTATGGATGIATGIPSRATPEPGRSGSSRRLRITGLTGGRAFLKAAAVILLLTAPLAAFPAVRAWVVDRVTPAAVTESTSTDPDAVLLRFTPTPGGFQVRFPAGTAGLLALERSSGEEAELRVMGGTPETVVRASSLEIRNDDTGRYELRLPATVTGVWVRVGERAVSVSDAQIGRGAVVELGG